MKQMMCAILFAVTTLVGSVSHSPSSQTVVAAPADTQIISSGDLRPHSPDATA